MFFLKLHPYRKRSLAKKGVKKHSPKFCELYLVLKRIGKIAYRVELPSKATTMTFIYLMVHIFTVKERPLFYYLGVFEPAYAHLD